MHFGTWLQMNFIFWIQNEMTLVISAPDVARFKTQFSIRSVFETVIRAHRIGFDECLDSKDSKRSTFSKDLWTKPIYSSEYEITKVFFQMKFGQIWLIIGWKRQIWRRLCKSVTEWTKLIVQVTWVLPMLKSVFRCGRFEIR